MNEQGIHRKKNIQNSKRPPFFYLYTFMKNLKQDIYIAGFDNTAELQDFILYTWGIMPPVLYEGKTLDLTEEDASNYVSYMNRIDDFGNVYRTYRRYPAGNYEVQSLTHQFSYKTALDSIATACNKEYCLIFKK